MVQFLPLDVTDEDSIGTVLSHIDNAIQFVSFPRFSHVSPSTHTDARLGAGLANMRKSRNPRTWTTAILTSGNDARAWPGASETNLLYHHVFNRAPRLGCSGTPSVLSHRDTFSGPYVLL